MVQMKRFDYDPLTWTRVKLNHRFEFPSTLDLSNHMDPDFQIIPEQVPAHLLEEKNNFETRFD